MAAAALGQAARRLSGSGGALRQAQEAAVSRLGQRRPLPRLTHTEAGHPDACSGGTTENGCVLKQIHRRKEELYELMTEAHRTHGTGRDGKLFQCLSGHVEPRPSDPTWRWNQTSKRGDEVWKTVGIAYTAATYVTLSVLALANLASWKSSP